MQVAQDRLDYPNQLYERWLAAAEPAIISTSNSKVMRPSNELGTETGRRKYYTRCLLWEC